MIRELKTFLAVVRYGTFASAGYQIGLTQSAVSAQIQRLEEDLGFLLFDRTGRSAVLNAAGRQTVALAEELLNVYAKLSDQGDTAEKTGLIRAGAIASVQASFLVHAIEGFRQKLPGWRVRVVPGVSLNLLAQVDSGEMDAAVIIRPPFSLPGELTWQSLLAEPFVLAVSAELAGQPWREVLKSRPFIRYDRNSYGGRLVDRFLKKNRIAVDDVVELDELQGIVGLVQQRVGVALIPQASSLLMPEGVSVLALGADTFYREIGLVQPNTRGLHAAALHFAACVIAAAGNQAAAPSA
ncbi:LysR family transcriptional regulator [Massilia sp. LXY-6]|uniref:LysR family transcriptional regulator n=1 Tax=Massilia sp. LXY-6 TaxID=3379823 RepID=UPI003EE0A038